MKNNFFQKIKSESGMTLVEILAAITILAIIVTAFLGFFVQAGRTNNRTDEENEATFIAQEEMEYITSFSGGDYTASVALGILFPVNDKTYEPSKDYPGYTITGNYSQHEESSLYRIYIKVEGGNGRAEMETYVPFEQETGE